MFLVAGLCRLLERDFNRKGIMLQMISIDATRKSETTKRHDRLVDDWSAQMQPSCRSQDSQNDAGLTCRVSFPPPDKWKYIMKALRSTFVIPGRILLDVLSGSSFNANEA